MFDKIWDFFLCPDGDKTDKLLARTAVFGIIIVMYFIAARFSFWLFIGVILLIGGFIFVGIITQRAEDKINEEWLEKLRSEDDGVEGYIKVRPEELEGAPWVKATTEAKQEINRKEQDMTTKAKQEISPKDGLCSSGGRILTTTEAKQEISPTAGSLTMTETDNLQENLKQRFDNYDKHDDYYLSPGEGETGMLRGFGNFDEFCTAQADTRPLHQREVNRNEDGRFGEHFTEYGNDKVAPPPAEAKFGDIFQEGSIYVTKIRNLLFSPEDRYERVMGVSFVIMLFAVFNPFLIMGAAFGRGDFLRLGFVMFIVGLFLMSLLAMKASFPLWVIGGIAFFKMFFWESIGDTFLAAAMFTTVYLMFRMKRRKDADVRLSVLEKARTIYGEEFGTPKIIKWKEPIIEGLDGVAPQIRPEGEWVADFDE